MFSAALSEKMSTAVPAPPSLPTSFAEFRGVRTGQQSADQHRAEREVLDELLAPDTTSVNDDDEWADLANDATAPPLVSLFSATETFEDADALWDHCASMHGFKFHDICTSRSLDFYGKVRLVNFVRREVAGGAAPDAVAASVEAAAPGFFAEGDELLMPVLEDDAVLTVLGQATCGDDSDWSDEDDGPGA